MRTQLLPQLQPRRISNLSLDELDGLRTCGAGGGACGGRIKDLGHDVNILVLLAQVGHDGLDLLELDILRDAAERTRHGHHRRADRLVQARALDLGCKDVQSLLRARHVADRALDVGDQLGLAVDHLFVAELHELWGRGGVSASSLRVGERREGGGGKGREGGDAL